MLPAISIIEALIIIAFFIAYRKCKKADQAKEKKHDAFINAVEKAQQKANNSYQIQVNDLIRTTKANQKTISKFRSALDFMQIPFWMKDLEFRMLYLNEAYEKHFLHPMGLSATDYVGNMDIDVWGEKIGQEFVQNDQRALSEKGHWTGIETIEVAGTDVSKKYMIYKYVSFDKNLKPVAICGFAYPIH